MLKSIKKKLIKGFSNTGGRNNQGKITSFHKGKGHKQLYRKISFKKNNEKGIVQSIEYDPNRTAYIALIKLEDNKYKYILASENLKAGDKLNYKFNLKQTGNTLKLKKMLIGTQIHNLELQPNQGSKLLRSAGTYGQIIQIQKKYVKVRLASNEQRLILKNCLATIGKVSNSNFKNIKLKKAGNSRWLGRKPIVRGVAMNPIDHPHGGGEGKTSGGRCSVTPWSKLTKGKKTVLKPNNLIIKRRYNKKKKE